MYHSGSCSLKVSFVSFFVYCTCLISNGTGKFLLEIVAIIQLQVTCCVARKTECCLPSFFIRTATAITKVPMSVTAQIGTNAQFQCTGTGNYLVWEVDGLTPGHPDILARGMTVVTLPSSGTVQSNLTVPATSENNGTTVRCAIGVSQFSLMAISNYSTLTVLPGELFKVIKQ